MERFLTVIIMGCAAIAPFSIAHAQSQPMADRDSYVKSVTATDDLSTLPPAPRGKSTILGGEIRNVDPVLDQLTLRVFGQRPMKVQFDERTQVFRDGTRIPLRELRPEEHASVQTVLDGANIFAISIHMLSKAPEGECQGRVLSFDPESRELTVRSSLSIEPIKLLLGADTPIVREGQGAFTSGSAGSGDLVNGALVTVKFAASQNGRAVANYVTVLAKPGSDFVFSGKLSSLDVHSGVLVLVDPRDQSSYQISFDPASIHGSESLHIGDQVRVVAGFDGMRYTAIEIAPNQTSQP